MSRKLTAKQQQFVLEYLVDLNATQAAIRAGYSKNSAKEIGCQNLSKVNIKEAIDKEIEKRSKRVKMTADDVLREIIELMQRNKESDDKLTLDALKLLGKHYKLFTDVVENKIDGGLDLTISWADDNEEDN